jgi:hypothetical protein
VAWAFITNYYANYAPLSLAACRAQLVEGGNYAYWSYAADTLWRPEMGALRSTVQMLRRWSKWQWVLTRDNPTNPFFYDTAQDQAYWFPK